MPEGSVSDKNRMESLESYVDLRLGGQALPSVVKYSYVETEFMFESLDPREHDTELSRPRTTLPAVIWDITQISTPAVNLVMHVYQFIRHRPLIHCTMTKVIGKLYEQAIEAPWHVPCFLTSDCQLYICEGVSLHNCYRKKKKI